MKKKQLVETLLEVDIPNYYGVEHKVNQYVDNSSNVIDTDSKEEIQKYVESYLKVLEAFYFHNKLKLNSSKTKMMVTKIPENKQNNQNMKSRTSNGKISQPATP